MKLRYFIITALLLSVIASCGSGSKETAQDTTAALDEETISQICEKHKVECGDFLATVNGSLKALFCGDCESGFVCDDATNKCMKEEEDEEPADDNDEPQDDSDDPQESGSRTVLCTDLPENAEWNIVSEITQTFDGENWLPSEKAVFNSESSTERCRFICREGYVWNSEDCVSYTPSGLPKCRANVTKPCEDPLTGLIWSEIILNRMDRDNAKAYCDDYDEGGYNDWHLPNVDEMRSVIRNCSKMITGGECPVSESGGMTSASGSNWMTSCTCSESEAESILGNWHKTLWTSSLTSDSPIIIYAWTLDSNLSLSIEGKNSDGFFHCVRSDYFLRDDHCGKHYTWDGSECIADTRKTECKGLPENAQWNSVSAITQTWNGTYWEPSEFGSYNTASSSYECRFKCYEEFTWDGYECALKD